MDLNEKIKKYRKEAGLSQEALASKIFVSRTLITKYESGSAFPTEENLKKIATALGITIDNLLSNEEKNEIVEKSYKNNFRLWMVLNICFASVSFILIFLSVIPFYHYSSYDYSNVTMDNPIPAHVTGYTSIISATLRVGNPISIINIILLIVCLIFSLLTFTNFEKKTLKIIRIITIVLFVLSTILFFFSFASMVSIVSAPGFQMNIRE